MLFDIPASFLQSFGVKNQNSTTSVVYLSLHPSSYTVNMNIYVHPSQRHNETGNIRGTEVFQLDANRPHMLFVPRFFGLLIFCSLLYMWHVCNFSKGQHTLTWDHHTWQNHIIYETNFETRPVVAREQAHSIYHWLRTMMINNLLSKVKIKTNTLHLCSMLTFGPLYGWMLVNTYHTCSIWAWLIALDDPGFLGFKRTSFWRVCRWDVPPNIWHFFVGTMMLHQYIFLGALFPNKPLIYTYMYIYI